MAYQIKTNTSTLQSVLEQINALPEAIDITIPLSELNATNGGTTATTIGAAVGNTEVLVAEETSLIEQIDTALDNLGAGSGGEVAQSVSVINNSWNSAYCDLFNEPIDSGIFSSGLIINNNKTVSVIKGSYIAVAETSGGFPVYVTPVNSVVQLQSTIEAFNGSRYKCYRINADCRFYVDDSGEGI